MNPNYLELELRLLFLRYGKDAVLAMLPNVQTPTPKEMADHLSQNETVQHNKRARNAKPTEKKKQSLVALLDSAIEQRPETAEVMNKLAIRFHNRTFLPTLRDVQRFLDKTGPQRHKLKSRESSIPHLARVLAGMPLSDLVRLSAQSESRGESDFSLLAGAIMGTTSTPTKPPK